MLPRLGLLSYRHPVDVSTQTNRRAAEPLRAVVARASTVHLPRLTVPNGPWLPVLVLASWAVVASLFVFPNLSHNHDEGIYLTQADALRQGDLTVEAPANALSFRPWLTAVHHGRYVFKYTPVHSAFLAAARTVFGTYRAGLVLITGALVGLVYLLARELGANKRTGVVAAWLFGLSPLVVIQAGTYLPYLSMVALLAGFAVTLLRGLRLQQARWLALSGGLIGLGVFARPFDAVLFGGPFAVHLLLVAARRREMVRCVGPVALGALPPLASMLLFNRAVTGSFSALPFNLLEPSDTVGFGLHRIAPGYGFVRYGIEEVLAAFRSQALWLQLFAFGGPVLIGLFVWHCSKNRGGGRLAALAATAVTVPVGYLFFWGPYNMSHLWQGIAYLGPFYWMPMLLPLAVGGALGLHRLHRLRPRLAVVAAGVMVCLDLAGIGYAVLANYRASDKRAAVTAGVDASRSPLTRRLVILPATNGPWLLHPLPNLRNPPELDTGADLYAVDRGARNLGVLAQFPDRAPYQLQARSTIDERPGSTQRAQLVPLAVSSAAAFDVRMRFTNPTANRHVAVQVVLNSRVERLVIDDASVRGRTYDVAFRLTPLGVEWTDQRDWRRAGRVAKDFPLTISAMFSADESLDRRRIVERRYWYRTGPGQELEVLLPGEPFVNRRWPTGGWEPDAAEGVDITVEPVGGMTSSVSSGVGDRTGVAEASSRS
ncbi:MAG: hypothetical protein CYG61_03185 [Actinobacteria bacterium]|nr:MAG: hypothetical protein CYG61_03185 [Actinomycetota bacterium]